MNRSVDSFHEKASFAIGIGKHEPLYGYLCVPLMIVLAAYAQGNLWTRKSTPQSTPKCGVDDEREDGTRCLESLLLCMLALLSVCHS